ncbi:plasmid partitioning protein RepB [Pseudooceanicola sp. CBS1P-1]|uniref:Plasmid partitioning protein RepB n=1 Tax=Pseudooceanicola albus TaxID=2692189 RepID=A0A6L7G7G3_9RHOB|nr:MULTISPECIES: plasmid partitioning protein RepB [Pseudooceanicola]MBT9384383.1 plasmid partitioning protein RepB [Pseudooceanicola endophyticus]MXN19879.1 plasmid partitioning protein RepB [Pseudooceanicola albus]
MARKGILSRSLDRTLSGAGHSEKPEAVQAPSPAPERNVQPRSGNPTVKRFKETFEDLRKETVQEIDTARIGVGRFKDRFDPGAEIDGLVASIRESGQQIPVLLRAAPAGSGFDFEPVYGRRRIAACRRIGIPVRAHVSDVDDEAMIVAQGLENAERLENSFIEKSAFIVQLREAGIAPRVIERSLSIPAAEISRMTGVIRDIPEDLVTAIGPAHGVGRRQWVSLASVVKSIDKRRVQTALKEIEDIPSSAERFARVLARLTKVSPAAPRAPEARSLAEGRLQVTRRGSHIDMKVSKADRGFLDWLADQGEALYQQWKSEGTQDK